MRLQLSELEEIRLKANENARLSNENARLSKERAKLVHNRMILRKDLTQA